MRTNDAIKMGDGLALPAELVTVTSAVLGIRGTGKTHTATVMVEGLLERGQQVVILDPTDAWWGLKSSADGKKEAFPILVVGGEHGDLPLERGAPGSVFADLVVEDRASVIFSLRHLPKSEQRRFVTDFAEALYHRKGVVKHRSPMLLVVDECDTFIPQRVGGAEARMVGAFEDLVRRGRSSGIGCVLISQRPASINKDVLTQAEMIVCHRLLGPQDRKAVEAWVEAHDSEGRRGEFMASLAGLPKGVAWFWSPVFANVFRQVAVRERATFDSSATPNLGTKAAAPTTLAVIDLDRYRTRLAAVIDEAKAKDPKALKAKIAALEAQLADRAAAAPDPAVIEAAVSKAVADCRAEFDRSAARWRKEIADLQTTIHETMTGLSANVSRFGTILPATIAAPVLTGAPMRFGVVEGNGVHKATKPRKAAIAPLGQTELTKYQEKLLGVILSRSPVPTGRHQLSTLSGYSSKSSSFGIALCDLIRGGLVEEVRGGYVATESARKVYGDALGESAPLSGPEALDHWLRKLPTYEGVILKAMADRGIGRDMTTDSIADLTERSKTSSSFGIALRNLVELGLLTKRDGLYAVSENFR